MLGYHELISDHLWASHNKVLVQVQIRSSWKTSLLQPLGPMPDKPAEAKVGLSKMVDHLHLLHALGPTLPALVGPVGEEDGEELGDVDVVVVGLQVAQELCPACVASSARGALRRKRVGRVWSRRRSLRKMMLAKLSLTRLRVIRRGNYWLNI